VFIKGPDAVSVRHAAAEQRPGTATSSNYAPRFNAAAAWQGNVESKMADEVCRAWERGWFAEIPALAVGQGKARSVSRKGEAASGKAAVPIGWEVGIQRGGRRRPGRRGPVVVELWGVTEQRDDWTRRSGRMEVFVCW
jgi:hypothetical protein